MTNTTHEAPERMFLAALYEDRAVCIWHKRMAVEYVRADRIEELEAKLQAVVEDKVDVVVELTKLKTHLEDFFALLEITEQKEDGRYFHPTTIRSSRALDAEKLEKVLAELKRSITANDKSDG